MAGLRTRLLSAAAAMAMAAFAGGCGDSHLGTVSGQVTYDGTPIEKGTVNFLPANGSGPSVGGDVVGGKYSVTEVPPGPKIVEVVAVKDVPFVRSTAEMAQMAEEAGARGDRSGIIDRADIVPSNAVGNNATHQIAEGEQTLDLTLTAPAK